MLTSPLNSGLKFTQVALARSQADKAEELSVSFSKSYEETLKKYHSFVVKPIFAVSFPARSLLSPGLPVLMNKRGDSRLARVAKQNSSR